MWIIPIFLAVGIIGACVWSLVKCFTGKKNCCGTEKQPRIKAKRLSAPIGSLSIKIGGMRCENCCRSVNAALNALDGVAAKVSLESGTASVSSERPVSDEELTQAVESAGFDLLDIRR